jgi:tetratricopeptide (TPR) repeat protein/predicted aspartyl protease
VIFTATGIYKVFRARYLLAVAALALCGSRAQAACQLARYAELPVTISNARAFVAGSVNGVNTSFFADSGAFFSMISAAAARRFNIRLEPLPYGMQVRGIDGGGDFYLGKAKNFSLAGMGDFRDVDFIVGGNAFAGDSAGIIGQNVIGHADTEYDLANGVIRLMHSKGCEHANLAYWQQAGNVSVMPIDVIAPAAPHVIGQITLNGAKIRAIFDSGAMRSMLDKRAARRAGIKLDGPEVTSGGVWGGINGRNTETWISRFDTLDLGGETIRNARLRIADIDLPANADMLLGMDFFLSHHIYVASHERKIFFTYNGGHVFDLRATESEAQAAADVPAAGAAPATSELEGGAAAANASTAAIIGAPAAAQASAPSAPTDPQAAADAAVLRRRGAASAERMDFTHALPDLNRAVELAPDDPENYRTRAGVYWRSGNGEQALRDFDQALKYKPDDVALLLDRGTLRLQRNDADGAHADLERAELLAARDPAVSLRIAQAYAATGRLQQAVSYLDRWVSANPRDDRMPGVLGERCWLRALTGGASDQALSDCNRALSGGQHTARAYEGRGLSYLRSQKFDKAIADFTGALQLQPRDAEALYGRGLAESGKGLKESGDKDMDAAIALRASAADEFKRIGLAPEH